jgi:outer membrane immunogenic protein
MKKLLLGAAVSLAMVGGASAADLYTKAPVYSWTGFYFGVEGGYGWGQTSHLNVVTNIGSDTANINGGIVGGTYGYNLQTGRLVLGFEGDISGSGIGGHFSSSNGFCGTAGVQTGCLTNLTWLGTDRVRAGFLVTPMTLIYATGGVAYGNIRAGIDATICPTCTIEDHARSGYTVGGGLEHAFGGHWTAKAEYLYVNLGSAINYSAAGGLDGESVSFKTNIVRGGINYKF